MTRRLVSDSEETKRFMYLLMKDLAKAYETHERLEKRINIDNFEDEELMNSGSFMECKKSKNSKKQNQEVLKDIQESELFHFFKVVIQEITAADIEQRYAVLKAGEKVRLGAFFLSMIEFLESASSAFCGFQYDINQMIIEKDLFVYLFDIMEAYKYSDFLITKVFKILDNIIKAKNEDIMDMVRYLVEDTPLIPFLINNGPTVIESYQETQSEAQTQRPDKDQSGSQSSLKSPINKEESKIAKRSI